MRVLLMPARVYACSRPVLRPAGPTTAMVTLALRVGHIPFAGVRSHESRRTTCAQRVGRPPKQNRKTIPGTTNKMVRAHAHSPRQPQQTASALTHAHAAGGYEHRRQTARKAGVSRRESPGRKHLRFTSRIARAYSVIHHKSEEEKQEKREKRRLKRQRQKERKAAVPVPHNYLMC